MDCEGLQTKVLPLSQTKWGDEVSPIVIEVTGIPKAQPRPKAFARKFGNGKYMARVYDPGTAEGWKGQIALAAKGVTPFPPLQGPLSVSIEFRMPRPLDHYKSRSKAAKLAGAALILRQPAPYWHISKPDADNASKAVFDCLTTLGMWKDDSQVCEHMVTKVYADRPGATITITPLEEPKRQTDRKEAQLSL
jgi:Holliday junction resolvase RusA-like endonuclease